MKKGDKALTVEELRNWLTHKGMDLIIYCDGSGNYGYDLEVCSADSSKACKSLEDEDFEKELTDLIRKPKRTKEEIIQSFDHYINNDFAPDIKVVRDYVKELKDLVRNNNKTAKEILKELELTISFGDKSNKLIQELKNALDE